MTEPIKKRACKFCKAELQGRVDKVFCSTPCRNAWHNQERHFRERNIRMINGILKRNWKILLLLNRSGKSKVQREQLLAMQFDFNYFTSILKTRSGNTYFYCYDQGYLEISDELLLLVHSKHLSLE